MQRRTGVVLGVVCTALAALVLFGFGSPTVQTGFTEAWVSDTPRNNSVNHHAVGVGPAGEIVVAPVAAVPSTDVALTNTSCALVRLRPDDGSTVWRTGMPADDCFTHALTQPAIEDVNSDGSMEVLVSTTEDALIAYSATDGSEVWRIPLSTYGYGRPTVADILPDPGPEVVTSDIGGGAVVAYGNGTVAWRATLNETALETRSVWATPLVKDFDADGTPEILFGSNNGPVAFDANGSVEWVRGGGSEYTAAAQGDADPAIEVFTAGTTAVRAYDGTNGTQQWQRELTKARIRTANDADGDGTVELFVGLVGGDVAALDAASGETEWTTTITASDDTVVVPPVAGDLTGDGQSEVLVALQSGTVVALDAESGAEIGTYERPVPIWTFPTVADTDGDGTVELLVRYGDGRVIALDWTSNGDLDVLG